MLNNVAKRIYISGLQKYGSAGREGFEVAAGGCYVISFFKCCLSLSLSLLITCTEDGWGNFKIDTKSIPKNCIHFVLCLTRIFPQS
jgi:hypothetical protein